MSAFMCSDKHISSIVNSTSFGDTFPSRFISISNNDIFAKLVQENQNSLDARYADEKQDTSHQYNAIVRPKTVVEAMKLIQSYQYQSCEHDGWETSFAKDFTDALLKHLVFSLPGYASADWAI